MKKSEIRNPNSETIPNTKIRNKTLWLFFGLGFGIWICFGFRISDLGFPPQRALGQAPKSAALFELRPGEHVCIIGNTLADRMQHDGWLETYLQSRFPKHQLVVRNLGFSGDEVAGYTERPDQHRRMRSMDFGKADEWLAGKSPIPQPGKLNEGAPVTANRFEKINTHADVIFAFFGYNESFVGEAGLDKFKADLESFIKHTLAQKYNGKSAPRLVLFSP